MGLSCSGAPASIVPFPPGHIQVFDLKPNGKVESIQMEAFHLCTQEPAHAAYDGVPALPSGTAAPPQHRDPLDLLTVSSQVWMRRR